MKPLSKKFSWAALVLGLFFAATWAGCWAHSRQPVVAVHHNDPVFVGDDGGLAMPEAVAMLSAAAVLAAGILKYAPTRTGKFVSQREYDNHMHELADRLGRLETKIDLVHLCVKGAGRK